MPVQDFSINTKAGYAGDLYGLTYTNSQRNTYIAKVANAISYGYAVKSDDGVSADVGSNADGTITGVVIRSLNMEQAKRPGDGSIFFGQGVAMAVLEEGYIQIDCTGARVGDDLYVTADGLFTTDAGAGGTAVINAAIFREADQYGLAVVWVENHLTFAAVSAPPNPVTPPAVEAETPKPEKPAEAANTAQQAKAQQNK
ncbi:structural cement protein Gp24 [Enterobacter ludwigii]|uniref:structural cement protein Gp24 n=1 Tax=Enterobacter ludwigii TaxID=299767 RepID=UPI003BEF3BA1